MSAPFSQYFSRMCQLRDKINILVFFSLVNLLGSRLLGKFGRKAKREEKKKKKKKKNLFLGFLEKEIDKVIEITGRD